ncbi:hypothetical protein KO481_14815 [Nocardia sp. NEAU-G5]|uniref:Peptidase M48 domain-containing protein n=1 Tax=Nocardia albiluteola TaxID=2842303 RepID=A0ABS6B0L0_9NOCA|nr:hypothetical protein [Nocardia albiluteola]MBU3062788.1 hypothetical protein [Nocardia albiluteola]
MNSVVQLALAVPGLMISVLLVDRVRMWLGTWPALAVAVVWLLFWWFARGAWPKAQTLVRVAEDTWCRPDAADAETLDAAWDSVVRAVGVDRSVCQLAVGKGAYADICAFGDDLIGVTQGALTTLTRSDLEALLALQLGRQLYNTPRVARFVRWTKRPIGWFWLVPTVVAGVAVGLVAGVFAIRLNPHVRARLSWTARKLAYAAFFCGFVAVAAWLCTPIVGLHAALAVALADAVAPYGVWALERHRITRAYRIASELGADFDAHRAATAWLHGRSEDTTGWRWWTACSPVEYRFGVIARRMARSEPYHDVRFRQLPHPGP